MLKFGQRLVTTKDFHGQRQITYMFMIDVNNVVVSDKVTCNNGKDYRYIVGYQVDGMLILFFIKTPKDIYIFMVCHNARKALSRQCHSMSLREKGECLNIKRFGMRLSHSYLKNWQQNQEKQKARTSIAS